MVQSPNWVDNRHHQQTLGDSVEIVGLGTAHAVPDKDTGEEFWQSSDGLDGEFVDQAYCWFEDHLDQLDQLRSPADVRAELFSKEFGTDLGPCHKYRPGEDEWPEASHYDFLESEFARRSDHSYTWASHHDITIARKQIPGYGLVEIAHFYGSGQPFRNYNHTMWRVVK